MKYFNSPLRLSTDTRMSQGNSGYSKSAFANVEHEFPSGLFGGLIATIGLCLLGWAGYVKHQQALAVTNCIEAEMLSIESTAPSSTDSATDPRDIMNRVQEQTQVIPEERLERANNICEMKCIRGSLSGCQ